jgi:NAD(P)-dependent dehydrogenase (short-subunit alcohol dehydrogenase family)
MIGMTSTDQVAGPVDSSLEGRVAVVTGGSRGIGKQTCLALARRGAQVVIAARTEEPRAGTPGTLGETAAEVAALGKEPVVVRADLARDEDVDELVRVALDRCDGVDILVNNAAYTVGKALWAHVPDLTRDQWNRSLAVNVTAPLMLIQGFWESMKERGGGRVVNVTSGAATMQTLDFTRATPGLEENGPVYGTTKAALNRMANVIATEGAPHHIAVINVEPGFVLTETMAETFKARGVTDSGGLSPTVPAAAIAYLCTCDDPMRYSGQVVSAPALAEELGLV